MSVDDEYDALVVIVSNVMGHYLFDNNGVLRRCNDPMIKPLIKRIRHLLPLQTWTQTKNIKI